MIKAALLGMSLYLPSTGTMYLYESPTVTIYRVSQDMDNGEGKLTAWLKFTGIKSQAVPTPLTDMIGYVVVTFTSPDERRYCSSDCQVWWTWSRNWPCPIYRQPYRTLKKRGQPWCAGLWTVTVRDAIMHNNKVLCRRTIEVKL